MKNHKKTIKHKKKTDQFTKVHLFLGIALLLFIAIVTVQLAGIKTNVNQELELIAENSRPADIKLMIITDSTCIDCFDIETVVEYVEGRNVNVLQSIDYSPQDAKSLIEKYSINKLPALIVTGELDKVSLKDFEQNNDALIYMGVIPPFTDPTTMIVKGKVSTTLLVAEDCDLCANLQPFVDNLKQTGISITEENTFSSTDQKGKNLIEQYSIKYLPALIVSDDIVDYGDELVTQLEQNGFSKQNDAFVFHSRIPPYINLSSGNVEGLISVTYLTDDSCVECYDAEQFHKPIIKNLGAVVENEFIVDVSSDKGKELIDSYSITKVPTLILGGDVIKYPSLVAAWKQVGTQESDNTFIFREMAIIGQVYNDLELNQVIDPTKQ